MGRVRSAHCQSAPIDNIRYMQLGHIYVYDVDIHYVWCCDCHVRCHTRYELTKNQCRYRLNDGLRGWDDADTHTLIHYWPLSSNRRHRTGLEIRSAYSVLLSVTKDCHTAARSRTRWIRLGRLFTLHSPGMATPITGLFVGFSSSSTLFFKLHYFVNFLFGFVRQTKLISLQFLSLHYFFSAYRM